MKNLNAKKILKKNGIKKLMINRYREYLSILDKKLSGMFQKQAPFIQCKNGCAYCCKKGKYPMSELEFINLIFYFYNLSEEIKNPVYKQIEALLKNPMPESYECPFLYENSCSVYPARALICRSFGLMTFYRETKMIPFCVDLGLNYAGVYDDEQSKVICKAPDGTEPLAFNVDRRTLRGKNIEQEFKIFFGEDKALYDWLKEEFSEC